MKPFVPESSCHTSRAKPQFWGTQTCPFLVPALRQPDLGRKSTVWQIDSTRTHIQPQMGLDSAQQASCVCLVNLLSHLHTHFRHPFPSASSSPVILKQGSFDLLSHLQPPGDIWPCLKMVFVITPAGHWNCCWHLVGQGQVCSSTSYGAQVSLTQYRMIWPNRSVGERPRNGLWHLCAQQMPFFLGEKAANCWERLHLFYFKHKLHISAQSLPPILLH